MWKDNIIDLKEKSNKTTKDIAQGVQVSESTIKRVFSSKKEDNKRGHSLDLIIASFAVYCFARLASFVVRTERESIQN